MSTRLCLAMMSWAELWGVLCDYEGEVGASSVGAQPTLSVAASGFEAVAFHGCQARLYWLGRDSGLEWAESR